MKVWLQKKPEGNKEVASQETKSEDFETVSTSQDLESGE